jgi:protein-disulfide isomerase
VSIIGREESQEPFLILFKESPKLSPDDLKKYAAQVGLDAGKFETCLSSGMHSAAVQKDIEKGKRIGITGTPAFFVNGRPLNGARPLEAFARVIDDELARVAAP